ncbi:MAG: SWIM zinc finger family protein, partial [Bacteroidota bacterium]
MSFSLDVLEQNVDEIALVQGEELFEQNAVESLQMVEKNLWIAKVTNLEVELKASSRKVEAVTCECEQYRQKGICGHIVAALLAL